MRKGCCTCYRICSLSVPGFLFPVDSSLQKGISLFKGADAVEDCVSEPLILFKD
jgi:hypothetical protein